MERRRIVFIGKSSFLAAALIATIVAMQRHREPEAHLVLSFETQPQRRGPLCQLPAIVARSESGGVLVALRNDTEDRQVFVDSVLDHLLIEYMDASGEKSVRVVAVPGRTLGPGDETEQVFVPLEERAGPARVEFVCTQYTANTRLEARTEVTVP